MTFATIAQWTAEMSGRAGAFGCALALVLAWAATGPLFGWSDTWQLVINTGTTIVTFMMVFLLQYAQNTDAKAVQLKLDEILRCMPSRDSDLYIDIEHADEAALDAAKRRVVGGP
jgi:low affinity Fe/Cu permease